MPRGLVDQLAVERIAQVVDQYVLEVPDVSHKGRFVEGPLGQAGHVGKDARQQRPG